MHAHLNALSDSLRDADTLGKSTVDEGYLLEVSVILSSKRGVAIGPNDLLSVPRQSQQTLPMSEKTPRTARIPTSSMKPSMLLAAAIARSYGQRPRPTPVLRPKRVRRAFKPDLVKAER
jgi:hypothetical protein